MANPKRAQAATEISRVRMSTENEIRTKPGTRESVSVASSTVEGEWFARQVFSTASCLWTSLCSRLPLAMELVE